MEKTIIPKNIYHNESNVWMIPRNTNGIVSFSNTKDIEHGNYRIHRVGNVDLVHKCAGIAWFDDKLIITPVGNAQFIEVFDTKNNATLKKIDVSNLGFVCMDNVFVYKEQIYVVNNWSDKPQILVIDKESLDISGEISIDRNLLWQEEKASRLLSNDCIFDKGVLQIVSCSCNYRIAIDVEEKNVIYHAMNGKYSNYVTISKIEDYYFMMNQNAELDIYENSDIKKSIDFKERIANLKGDYRKEEIEYVENFPGYRESYILFKNSVAYKNRVFFIPSRGNMLIWCDSDGDYGEILLPSYPGYVNPITARISSYYTKGQYIVLFDLNLSMYLAVDMEELKIQDNYFRKNNLRCTKERKYTGIIDEQYCFPFRLIDFICGQ